MVIVHPKSTFLKDEAVLDNVYNSSLCNNNAWKCVECLKVFYMKNRLKLHYVLEHNVPYCHLCDVFMEGAEDELGHRQRIHEGKTCDFCYLLINDTELSDHHRLEHDVISCPYCFAYIRPSSELGGHVAHTHKLKVSVDDPDAPKLFDQLGRESFRCFLCAENRKKELTGHFNIYHKVHTHILASLFVKYKVDLTLVIEGPEFGPTKNVSCEICDEKIPELVPTEFHFIYCHHQFHCVHCSTIFPTPNALNAHNTLLHERHPCKLDCANMAYNSSENLTRHYLAYHRIEVCKYCDEMVPLDAEGTVAEEDASAMMKHVKMAHSCVANSGGDRDGKLLEIVEDDDSEVPQLTCLLCNEIIPSVSPNEVYIHFNRDHSIISHKLLDLIGGNLLTKSIEGAVMNNFITAEDNEEDNGVKDAREELTDESFRPIFDEAFVECLFEFNEITADLETKCEICPEEFSSPLQYICHLFAVHNISIPKKYLQCNECNFKKNKNNGILLKHFNHYIEVENNRENDKCFHCNLCNTEISLLDAYEHYKKQHKDEKDSKSLKKHGYKCRFCKKFFWSAVKRDKHEIEKYFNCETNKYNFYTCLACDKTFTNPILIKKHKLECQNGPYDSPVIYHCLKCSMVLPSIADTTKHFQLMHGDIVRFLCLNQLCNGSFKERRTAKRHYYTVHVDKKIKAIREKKAKYLCNICGQSFMTKNSLGGHRHVHTTQKKMFKCSVCSERFITKAMRNSHVQMMHVGVNRFRCTECDLKFHSKTALATHRTIHFPQLKCPYCQKEFSRRDSYKEHLLIHEGPRHQCPHCPRAFTQMSNLRRHLRIHTGEKPYKCAFCDKTFSDVGACKSHTSIHTREQECKCEVCGKTYSKRQKLRYHMKTHTGEDMHPCHICNKDFVGRYALRVHLVSHEGGGQASIYVCDLCTKEWKTKRSLTRHRQSCKGMVIKERKYLKHKHKDPSEKKKYVKKKNRKPKNVEEEDDDDADYKPETNLLKNYELRESNKLAKIKMASQNYWSNEFPSDAEDTPVNEDKVKPDLLSHLDISQMMVSTMETGESEGQKIVHSDDGTDEDDISINKLKNTLNTSKLSTNKLENQKQNENIVKSEESMEGGHFVDIKVEPKEEQMADSD